MIAAARTQLVALCSPSHCPPARQGAKLGPLTRPFSPSHCPPMQDYVAGDINPAATVSQHANVLEGRTLATCPSPVPPHPCCAVRHSIFGNIHSRKGRIGRPRTASNSKMSIESGTPAPPDSIAVANAGTAMSDVCIIGSLTLSFRARRVLRTIPGEIRESVRRNQRPSHHAAPHTSRALAPRTPSVAGPASCRWL